MVDQMAQVYLLILKKINFFNMIAFLDTIY
jgi:hypothetical protein